LQWTDCGVGPIPGITQAVVVGRLSPAEVGVQSLGRKLVEAVDGARQFVCGEVGLASQVLDGAGAFDRAGIDQLGRQLLLTLQRVDTGDVAAYVAVVEDHPARHRLVRVHRLADLHVGVRLVAESPAGRVDVDGAGSLTARTQRRGDGPAVGDENRR